MRRFGVRRTDKRRIDKRRIDKRRIDKKLGIAMVFLAFVLGACSSPSSAPSGKPSFGGEGTESTQSPSLAKAKAKAHIEECPATSPAKAKDKGLPATKVRCLGGGDPVYLSGLANKPTVINMWASWCGPCKEELPILAKAHQEYGDKVQFLGIDFADPSPESAIKLAAAAGITYPLMADPDSSLKSSLRIIGLPETVFVDDKGTVVATERRAFQSYDDVERAISDHLGVMQP